MIDENKINIKLSGIFRLEFDEQGILKISIDNIPITNIFHRINGKKIELIINKEC